MGEEMHPTIASDPSIMLGMVEGGGGTSGKFTMIAKVPLESHVAGLCWLSSTELLIAAGLSLSILKVTLRVSSNDTLPPSGTTRMKATLPKFHTDDIRDIQVHRVPTARTHPPPPPNPPNSLHPFL